MSAARQRLTCSVGGHSWERPSQRGKPPGTCPSHQGQNGAQRPSQTALWCHAGEHPWERPATRGRKPANCPEHPAIPDPAPDLDPEEFPLFCWVEVEPPARPVKSAEELAAERERLGQERAERLDLMLKARGTHISQHA